MNRSLGKLTPTSCELQVVTLAVTSCLFHCTLYTVIYREAVTYILSPVTQDT